MSRRTPLHPQHLSAGARMVHFAGWEMPQQYASVKAEHQAVRTSAGLFDVSHMGRFEVSGEAPAEFLQGLVTNDLSRLEPGQAQYNLLCRPDGGILDDLVVYRGDRGWSLVVNASNRAKDMAWLRDHAGRGLEVRDRSDELALLALQGPRAPEVLAAVGADLDRLPYFGVTRAEVAGVEMAVSRTGYTGEDGFELFAPADRAGAVWEALAAAGALPCGLAARDVCRLEAGLRLYGNDMDESTNPYEAGLGWTVKLKKGEFSGRAALERLKVEGPKRVIAGLTCEGRTIPRHGAPVHLEGRPVGAVTSGTYSFFLERGIAMASVETGTATPGGTLGVETRGGEGLAEVVPLPFYRGSVKQAARA